MKTWFSINGKPWFLILLREKYQRFFYEMQFKKTFAGVLNTASKTQHYLPASLKSGDFLRCIRICVLQQQDQGNSSDDSTKTELKTGQTKLTRRWSAGGKRWRNTGEWKNSGNKMKANAGDPVQVGRKKNRNETEQQKPKYPENTVKYLLMTGPWQFVRFMDDTGEISHVCFLTTGAGWLWSQWPLFKAAFQHFLALTLDIL